MARSTFEGIALVAGEPALDFVNSVKYRGCAEAGDRLHSLQALLGWCEAAGILSADEAAGVLGPDNDAAVLEAVALRETFRAFLAEPTDPERCAALERLLARGAPVLQLSSETGRVRYAWPVRTPQDVVRRLEGVIARFLEDWSQERTRACQADDCDWVYVDRTKAGGRRWCDSRTCGNRDRVRRHRQQTQ